MTKEEKKAVDIDYRLKQRNLGLRLVQHYVPERDYKHVTAYVRNIKRRYLAELTLLELDSTTGKGGN